MKFREGQRVRVVHPRDSFSEQYRNEVGTVTKAWTGEGGYAVSFDIEDLDDLAFVYEDELVAEEVHNHAA